MPRLALVAALVVLAVGLGIAIPHYLVRDRDYVAVTPQAPSPITPTTLPLAAHTNDCMNIVALDSRSEQARLWPSTPGPRPVPLELTLSGEGYVGRARIPADYRDGAEVKVPVRPPRRSVVVGACVTNLGDEPATLAAVNDRWRSRSGTFVNGVPAAPAFALVFYERRPASIVSRLPVSLERMTILRPGVVGPATLWVLLALLVVVVPLGSLWALARAWRGERAARGGEGEPGP